MYSTGSVELILLSHRPLIFTGEGQKVRNSVSVFDRIAFERLEFRSGTRYLKSKQI